MILFGVRSPLVVDFEETLDRLGIHLDAAVSVNGVPRVADRSRLVDLEKFAVPAGSHFLAVAFAPGRRRALVEQALALGLTPAPGLVDPNAIVPRSLRVGDGSFVNAGVVVGALSITPGDRIVIRTCNEQAAVTGFISAILDGVVPVLLSPDTPRRRVRSLCETVEASLFIADEAYEMSPAWPATLTLSAQVPKRFGFAKAAGMLPGLAFPATGRTPRLPLDEAGSAYILFTSGTTSSPSGVCISRGKLFANLATLTRVFGYDATSRIFNDMILAHADGMIQGPVLAGLNGCAVIRSGGFQLGNIEAWLNRVRTTRATHVITVPTIWAMIDSFAAHDDYFDAPECRALLSVAAKLPEPLWQWLEKRFARPMFNQYGLTETVASAVYAGPHPEMGAFGTIGKPIDCDARIDPTASGSGELQFRGDQIFTGYWKDPDRSAASFVDDQWLKTGDLAQLQDDGSFQILGRIKTVIMSGGFLIHPDEIDEAMLLHPAVLESATVATFKAYAETASRLVRPSSLARALEAGALHVERVDLLVRRLLAARKLPGNLIDPVVDQIEQRLSRNRLQYPATVG